MSMCVLGMSEEFKSERIAVNGLWPKTGKILNLTRPLGNRYPCLRANANKNQKKSVEVESWGSPDYVGFQICWRW